MSDWEFVTMADELRPGSWMVVDVDDVMIAVFNIDGEFHAIEDQCSHEHVCLTGLPIEGDVITCPQHGAQFSIRTGEALCAPAYEAVPTFPTRIENGMLQVRDDRWD